MGDEFTFKSFSSTSKDLDQLPASRRVIDFRIKSKGGKDIESFSLNPGEREVLLPRNSRFKVTRILRNNFGGTIIELEEI